MKWKLTQMAALALLGVAARATAQGTFEGMVAGTMTADGKVVSFRQYLSGARSRQEYDMQGQTAVMIMDGTTGDEITLIPQQKKYLVMNMHQMGEAARQMAGALPGGRAQTKGPGDISKMKVTATGRRETIAGITCEHFEISDATKPNRAPMDMCGAPGMGFSIFGGVNGNAARSGAAAQHIDNPVFARMMRDGFFLLKMTIIDEDNKTMTWVVTQVDRRRPAASLFAPPPGYTKFEMPGMGGGSRH